MIAILTKDLMMTSSAASVAKRRGVEVKAFTNLDKVLATAKESNARLLLIDLQMPGFDLATLDDMLQKMDPEHRPYTIGYAQHVNETLIEQARAAALDEVMTRGQLNKGLDQLLERFAETS